MGVSRYAMLEFTGQLYLEINFPQLGIMDLLIDWIIKISKTITDNWKALLPNKK